MLALWSEDEDEVLPKRLLISKGLHVAVTQNVDMSAYYCVEFMTLCLLLLKVSRSRHDCNCKLTNNILYHT